MRENATRPGISFEPTDEQRELQALAHEFAERELRPIAREWDEREEYPSGLLAKAASAGLTSYAIPAEYGGAGAGSVTGGIAELTVVFAQAEEGITPLLVEGGDPGVTAGRKERKLGLRASYTGSLVLDDARVPPGRVLGEPGEGFRVAMDFFEVSRPQVAA